MVTLCKRNIDRKTGVPGAGIDHAFLYPATAGAALQATRPRTSPEAGKLGIRGKKTVEPDRRSRRQRDPAWYRTPEKKRRPPLISIDIIHADFIVLAAPVNGGAVPSQRAGCIASAAFNSRIRLKGDRR